MGPLALGAISGGIQAGAGILGWLASLPDQQKAQQIIESAIDANGQLNVPQLEQVVAQEIGPSAMANLRADPESVAAQRGALTRLGEWADAGYTMEDKAAQMEALRRSGRQEQAGRQRIASDAAARGQLGGGTTLAMMLANQQGAAERGADIGLQTAANSQRRMYEAMRDKASLAGNMRGQDWQEKSAQAQAADRVAQYNADARRSAQGANIANQQWTYGAQRQQGQDALQRAQMKAGIYSDRANRTATMFSGAGAGVAQGLSTFAKPQTPSYEEWVKQGQAGGWR